MDLDQRNCLHILKNKTCKYDSDIILHTSNKSKSRNKIRKRNKWLTYKIIIKFSIRIGGKKERTETNYARIFNEYNFFTS